jgi:WD40 repeat protein
MNRIRRWLLLSAVTAPSLIALPACSQQSSTTGIVQAGQPTTTPQKVDLGPPLYPAQKMAQLPASIDAKSTIVVPNAVVKFAEKQLVPAPVDGLLELIAVQLPPGASYDKNDKRIVFHPREKDKVRVFRMISPGMIVKKDDVVAWLDASAVEAQYENSIRLIDLTKESIRLSELGVDLVNELLKQLKSVSVIAQQEVVQMVVQLTRFQENVMTNKQTQIKAMQDYDSAGSMLRKHKPMAAVTGKVTNVFKRNGEYAKAGEPILEIQATEEILIEGELPIQYMSQVKAGMNVRIESTRLTSESREFGSISHRREVTGLAITSNAGRPLVVSTGLDGIAYVWEPHAKKQPHTLPHTVAVRSVAVSGAKSQQGSIAATGTEDGKIQFWNLSNPDKLPTESKSTDEGHNGPVIALAFSPDGKVLASSAGRDVIIWDATTGKKMYALPGDHKDSVTMLRFTPQATLITACRDKSVRVWNLGSQAASVDKIIDHRAGIVDHLAVSSDGSRVLFDQEENRIDVVSLADRQSVGTLQAAGQSSRFGGFAIFNSDDSLILTASNNPGEMQLWDAPLVGGRGFERLRLITPGRTTVTCAEFSPDATKKFVVVGTATGGVYLFTPPTERESQKITGTIESVLNYNEKSAMVRVRVLNPPSEVLQDRGSANIIIDPSATMAANSATMTVPVKTPDVTTNVVPAASGLGHPPSTVSPGSIIPIPTVPEKKNP